MITKIFLGLLSVSIVLASDYCERDAIEACSTHAGNELFNCNAKYGHVEGVMKDLQKYANIHIALNFQFLLMSQHFKNYKVQREGFAKLYKEYSDEAWEDSIKLIQYMTKRGGIMDFDYKPSPTHNASAEKFITSEIRSLSKSLDLWKTVAEEAHSIHGKAIRHQPQFHDPEVASYIENEFLHEHAEIIRNLAGHVNDLKRLLAEKSEDPSLALFLFDNMLKE